MAQTNTYVPTVTNSGARPIAPASSGPSPFSLLANLASNVSAISGNQDRIRRQRKEEEQSDFVFEQQKKAASEQDRKDTALDEMSSRVADAMQGIGKTDRAFADLKSSDPMNLSMFIKDVEEQIDIPTDVKQTVERARQAIRAVDQGRGAQASADILIERAYTEIMTKYPDQAYELSVYAHSMGLDNVMFRKARVDLAVQQEEDNAKAFATKEYADAARNAGMWNFNLSDAENIEAGRQLLAEKTAYERERTNLSLASDRAALSEKERKQQDERNGQRGVQYYSSQAFKKSGVAVQNFQLLMNQAGDDPEKQAAVIGTIPRIKSYLIAEKNATVNQMIRDGHAKEYIEQVSDIYDEQIKQVDTLADSNVKANLTAVEVFSSKAKLDSNQSLRAYSFLVNTFGRDVANQVITATGNLNSDELIKQVGLEISGLKVSSTGGVVSLINVGEVLSGKKKITEIPAEDRESAVKTSKIVVNANINGAVKGDPRAVDTWYKGYSPLLITSDQVSLAGFSPVAFGETATMLFGSQATTALTHLASQDGPRGEIAIEAGRRVAVKFITGRGEIEKQPNVLGQYQSVKFVNGKYILTYNEPQLKKDYAAGKFISVTGIGIGMGFGGVPTDPSYEEVVRRVTTPSKEAQGYILGLNQSMNYLVNTSQYDPNFAGVSEQETRAYWGLGVVPKKWNNRDVEKKGQDTKSFGEEVNSFNQSLDQGLYDTATGGDTELAGTKLGPREMHISLYKATGGEQVGPYVFPALIGNAMQESTLDPNAKGDGGTGGSIGLYQFHAKGRQPALRAWAKERGLDVFDPDTQNGFVVWDLKTNFPSTWEKMNNAESVDEATEVFMREYEKPNAKHANLPNRQRHARGAVGN